MGRYTTGGVGRDILVGAVAGVAAIWVADKLDQAIYRAGGPEGIRKTEAARPGGMDPAHVLAKRAADAVGVDVGDPKDNPAGHTIHYGIAAGMGALYGLLRGLTPAVSTGRGALFGMAMFVLQDQVGNTALGLAGNPLKYPVRDHARGAAAHTLFGIVTDLGTRLLSPWRDEVVIMRGPPVSERLDRGRAYLSQQGDHLYGQGREALEQGRGFLQQGIGYANRVLEQANSRMPDVVDAARRGGRQASEVADRVRSRTPDYGQVADLARDGTQRARRFAGDVRTQVADADLAGAVRAGQRRAGQVLDRAGSYVTEVSSPLSRFVARLIG